MCMANMIREYRAILENLEISQFAQLLQKAAESQKDRPISETKFRQKKHSTSYGSIHWWKKEEVWRKGIWHPSTFTMYPKRARRAPR